MTITGWNLIAIFWTVWCVLAAYDLFSRTVDSWAWNRQQRRHRNRQSDYNNDTPCIHCGEPMGDERNEDGAEPCHLHCQYGPDFDLSNVHVVTYELESESGLIGVYTRRESESGLIGVYTRRESESGLIGVYTRRAAAQNALATWVHELKDNGGEVEVTPHAEVEGIETWSRISGDGFDRQFGMILYDLVVQL